MKQLKMGLTRIQWKSLTNFSLRQFQMTKKQDNISKNLKLSLEYLTEHFQRNTVT